MKHYADYVLKSYGQTPAKHASLPHRIGENPGEEAMRVRMAGHVLQADAGRHLADGPARLDEIRAMIDGGQCTPLVICTLGIVESWFCEYAAAAEHQAALCQVKSLSDLYKADANACRKFADEIRGEIARAEALWDYGQEPNFGE